MMVKIYKVINNFMILPVVNTMIYHTNIDDNNTPYHI